MTRPEEDPADRARSWHNIAHHLREYAEQRHYDEKAERNLDANGFSAREWLLLQLAAAVLLIVGIAVWEWLG